MNAGDILLVKKMHAQSQAQFDHYNAAGDRDKAQYWIGRVNFAVDLLKTQGSEPDQTEVAKAKVDLDNLLAASGKELLKDNKPAAHS